MNPGRRGAGDQPLAPDRLEQKCELADAILNADNRSIIKSLSRDDLEFLLS